MSDSYPAVDESRDRLRRAGWSLGEVCMGGAWQVDGSNGENRFVARGGSQAEAWWPVRWACWRLWTTHKRSDIMRRRWWLFVGLTVLVLALGAAVTLSGLAGRKGRLVTREAFERIEEGMTPEEVASVIGLAPGDYTVYRYAGRFPAPFTEYNDLALEYLVGRLIEHEGLMIDEIARCAEQLAADPEAKRLAEEVHASEKRHLGLLTPLALADGQGVPGPGQPGTIL